MLTKNVFFSLLLFLVVNVAAMAQPHHGGGHNGGPGYGGGYSGSDRECRQMERPGLICELQNVGSTQRCYDRPGREICRDVPGGIHCQIINGRRICRSEPPRRVCDRTPSERICENVPRSECICRNDPGYYNPGNNFPPPHHNPPGHNYPPANDGSYADDLRGLCMDQRQFQVARDFAGSRDGLDLDPIRAHHWAMNYNQTHACSTIHVYINRYRMVYHFAESYDLLNIYRDLAKQTSLDWMERGYCGNENKIQTMINEYRKHFDYAVSWNGMRMNPDAAKRYSLQQLGRYFQCIDLFMRY